MTPGHRVTRFTGCSRATARKRAPWAQTIVRVGSTWVCYESAEDAGEEHGQVSELRGFWSPGGDYRDGFNLKQKSIRPRDIVFAIAKVKR